MMKNRFLILACLLLFAGLGFAQSSKSNETGEWVKVHDDDDVVTVYYNSNITTDKRGRHIVWVKAVYHSRRWQNYFAEQINSREPIVTTKTKTTYDELYNYAMVRQVQCFNKAGKKLYDSGDNPEGDWGPVNASDPVGIVGEYLEKQK
jgi:hypothetical protein